MPSFFTTRFGAVAYDAAAVIDFPVGLPGFDDERRFVLIEPEEHAPVIFLQSLSSADVCFLTLPVRTVDPCYELALSADDRRTLALEESAPPDALLVLTILCLPADSSPTANLLGPVVIHRAARRGVQAIRADTRYPVRYVLQVAGEDHREESSCS